MPTTVVNQHLTTTAGKKKSCLRPSTLLMPAWRHQGDCLFWFITFSVHWVSWEILFFLHHTHSGVHLLRPSTPLDGVNVFWWPRKKANVEDELWVESSRLNHSGLVYYCNLLLLTCCGGGLGGRGRCIVSASMPFMWMLFCLLVVMHMWVRAFKDSREILAALVSVPTVFTEIQSCSDVYSSAVMVKWGAYCFQRYLVHRSWRIWVPYSAISV